MATFKYALRGYGFATHRRDGFRCQYCDLDGSSWPNWLSLSVDHLLPKGHELRDEPDYIVTACVFCNIADNRYFDHADDRGLKFDGLTPEQLIEQRKPYVRAVRRAYFEFWEENVKSEAS